jgi:hypothetical protein
MTCLSKIVVNAADTTTSMLPISAKVTRMVEKDIDAALKATDSKNRADKVQTLATNTIFATITVTGKASNDDIKGVAGSSLPAQTLDLIIRDAANPNSPNIASLKRAVLTNHVNLIVSAFISCK